MTRGGLLCALSSATCAVAGDVGIEARVRQQQRHELAQIRIILDNQYADALCTLVTQGSRIVPIHHRSTVGRGNSHHCAVSCSHVTRHAEYVCT